MLLKAIGATACFSLLMACGKLQPSGGKKDAKSETSAALDSTAEGEQEDGEDGAGAKVVADKCVALDLRHGRESDENEDEDEREGDDDHDSYDAEWDDDATADQGEQAQDEAQGDDDAQAEDHAKDDAGQGHPGCNPTGPKDTTTSTAADTSTTTTPPADAGTTPSYVKDIAPISAAACEGSGCHAGTKPVKGIGLDSKDGWVASYSQSIKAINNGSMPIGRTLSNADIATIEAWKAAGFPD